MIKLQGESNLDYIKRLTLGKLNGEYKISYSEWSILAFKTCYEDSVAEIMFATVLDIINMIEDEK